jgi:hypothetical protein
MTLEWNESIKMMWDESINSTPANSARSRLYNVFICQQPMGAKLTLGQIFDRTGLPESFKGILREETEEMVKSRVFFMQGSGREGRKYAFTKDQQGNFSYQPAELRDKFRYYLTTPISELLFNELDLCFC